MAEPRARPPTRLIAAVALASGLTPLNSTMLSVALQPIGLEFGSDQGTLTLLLVTSYLVTSIVMQAPGGKLGDLLGHRRTVHLGQLVFMLGTLLAWLAPSLSVLVFARLAMGVAGALIVPSASALLRTELPARLRGRAYGVFGANMAFSAAVGPLLGGQVAHAFGWRALFSVNLVLLPLSALLAGRAPKVVAGQDAREQDAGAASGELAAAGDGLRSPPGPAPGPAPQRVLPPFDWRGSVLLGLALSAVVVGVGRGGSAPNWSLLAGSVVALALFVWAERVHVSPVVDLSLLGRKVFLASGGVIALQNLAMYSLLFELPTTCARVLGATSKQTGALLVAFMAPVVLLAPVAGRLADAVGARLIAVVGAVLATAGMIVLYVTPLRSMSASVPGLLVFGVGLAFSGSPAQSSGMSDVKADRSGVAAGMLATMRYLGGVAGTLALGVILAVPEHDHVAALSAHRSALLLFITALALSLGCAALLPRSPPVKIIAR